uniref:Periplasmic serine protease n=1 Tax=Fervidobacterium nodosum TaxID=2424 RepID=A0A7C5U4P7_9BACT
MADIFTIIFQIFWMVLILSSFIPIVKNFTLNSSRDGLISLIERKRKSRVITLIHRQESISFFGLGIRKFIDIEDSEEVLRAIKMTPDDMPIDFIIHTPGGLVLAAEQIANALKKHKGKVTVFVPHYAMSGGILIALAADEIVMDENAVLGPVDPQLGQYPAASILSVVKKKDINKVDDQTLILADIAEKAIKQMKEYVTELLKEKYKDRAEEIAEQLVSGVWTHDYPITVEKAKELGLNVSTDMPKEIYALMDMYRNSGSGRPSVGYVPINYNVGKNDKERYITRYHKKVLEVLPQRKDFSFL